MASAAMPLQSSLEQPNLATAATGLRYSGNKRNTEKKASLKIVYACPPVNKPSHKISFPATRKRNGQSQGRKDYIETRGMQSEMKMTSLKERIEERGKKGQESEAQYFVENPGIGKRHQTQLDK
ncbi:uncharacterized protein CIMG_12985 [Coccidioides immitis RS]|uniref:Uncharacterized protein n=1 Tax=Coccidioides immitis (strain RS) TaxID=246410 RepID=A0A0D8JW01_COCIM|nr:uncharacterized protein CIMG_12985 [Coccidioides immitis RS]KJF60463.1 hypothetical protein CIMG_12985 [Coccidioides immitis RS]